MPRQRRNQCVILDSEHVHPRTPMRRGKLRHRPHLAQLGAEQIVVRDRDVSNVQESAIQAEWFLCAAHARTRHCDFPMLITRRPTATTAEMVPHYHTWQRLLNGLLRRLIDPTRADQACAVRPTGPKRAANFYWAAAWEHRCHEHLEQPPVQLA